jgi:sigma-B regulation protein RsbU (phosphoserine phosphatase)
MNERLRVLIVEDSEDDTLLLVRVLRQAGYETVFRRVQTESEMTEALDSQSWDIVLSDHNMPGFSSGHALKLVRGRGLDTPFIIVSGMIGEAVAVEAMRAGAQDYIMKGQFARLAPAIDRELRDAQARRDRVLAEKALMAQTEELRIARDIQEGLFPSVMPRIDGYDIAGLSRPAEATGGDYFDFFPMRDGSLCLVVGDVTGHGIGPALLMSDVRACLRALAQTCTGMAEIMTHANRLLEADLGEDRFITMIAASLNAPEHRIEFMNAGHPAALVLGPDGVIKAQLTAAAPALGLNRGGSFPKAEVAQLAPGDMVLFLSDGVLESASPDGEDFGLDRVIQVLRAQAGTSAAQISGAVADAARRFSAPAKQQDDITVVVLKVL